MERVQAYSSAAGRGGTTALRRTQRTTSWWLVSPALGFRLIASGLFSYYGISKDGTDTYLVAEAQEFDSPRVVGLPMNQAVSVLVGDGYDVVAVGSGKVVLQELGFQGQRPASARGRRQEAALLLP